MKRARREQLPVAAAAAASGVARVLVIEPAPEHRAALVEQLVRRGFMVSAVDHGDAALALVTREDVDVVLARTEPAPWLGDLLRQLRQNHADVPVILMTGAGAGERSAARQWEAAGRIALPAPEDTLMALVADTLTKWEPQRERRRALRADGPHFAGVMGRSRVMRALCDRIARIASAQVPVLITGETGVGKELVAHAVHHASGRNPFVPVNCGAIPATLLESELFGHVRGAFTGADRDRVGLFEAAHGGTIFLDEIAELPIGLQSKLLRVLQSGELRRVGDVQARHVSVRLIAATHRSLERAVADGLFREDLFYRINVLRLELPPLRERTVDIPLLVEQFLDEIARRDQQPQKRFTLAALAHLLTYPWPGNVRELRNAIERVAVLSDADVLDVDDLPHEIRGTDAPSPALHRVGQDMTLAELEREHILAVLERVAGNRTRAAAILGLPRRTLYRRLREYGILDDD